MDTPGFLVSACLLGVVAGVYLLLRGLGGYRASVTLGDTATSSIAQSSGTGSAARTRTDRFSATAPSAKARHPAQVARWASTSA